MLNFLCWPQLEHNLPLCRAMPVGRPPNRVLTWSLTRPLPLVSFFSLKTGDARTAGQESWLDHSPGCELPPAAHDRGTSRPAAHPEVTSQHWATKWPCFRHPLLAKDELDLSFTDHRCQSWSWAVGTVSPPTELDPIHTGGGIVLVYNFALFWANFSVERQQTWY